MAATTDFDVRHFDRPRSDASLLRWGLLWAVIAMSFLAVIVFGLWSWGYNGYGGWGSDRNLRPGITGPGPAPYPQSFSGGGPQRP